jgi:hypothetical protein
MVSLNYSIPTVGTAQWLVQEAAQTINRSFGFAGVSLYGKSSLCVSGIFKGEVRLGM